MKKKLVLFYSDSCKPCHHQKPLVEKTAKEYKIPLELISVDNEKGLNFANNFGVKGWPYLLFIVDDIVKEEIIGYDTNSPEELNKKRITNVLKHLQVV
jgi:thiol-disulfide isomerase/thioredoxin